MIRKKMLKFLQYRKNQDIIKNHIDIKQTINKLQSHYIFLHIHNI